MATNSGLHNRLLSGWNSLGREGTFYTAVILFGLFLVVLGVWYGLFAALFTTSAVTFVEWRVQVYKSKQKRIERELREMLS